MLRSKVFLASLALFSAAACGDIGRASDRPDPCTHVHAVSKAIIEEVSDLEIRRLTLATHVVDNPTCYDADLVARSRAAIIQTTK